LLCARAARAFLCGTLLLLLAACTLAPPAIQGVSPRKDESNVAADAPIQITFDRPMDQQSVNSRLELKPAIPGCDVSSCPITWREQTLTFRHTGHEFLPGTKYTVVLHGGYRDAAARINDLDHTWDFTSEEAPRVRSASPSNGATAVATETEIVLQFSRAMVAPGPELLTLDPPVPARIVSDPADPSRVIIRPVPLLQPRTHYRVSVDANLTDTHHNALGAPYHLDFVTGAHDLTRTLAFAVLDSGGQATRIAVLHPPATLGSPRPGLRVVYSASEPIRDFGFTAGARSLYVLTTSRLGRGTLAYVPVEGQAIQVAGGVKWMSTTPGGDSVAYVDADHFLHVWSLGAGDILLPRLGHVQALPAWSGDGTRLALATDLGMESGTPGAALWILDAASLASYHVPGITLRLPPSCDACHELAWSRDGTSLLAVAISGGAGQGLYVYSPLASRGPLLQMVSFDLPLEVAWSADSANIYAALNGGIARAPARPVPGQSLGLRLISGSMPGDEAPATPTFDRRIAFVRSVDAHPQLFLMNNDGTGLVQMTFPDYDPADDLVTFGVVLPRWAPAA